METKSRAVHIESLPISDSKHILVARDDLLQGGTKERGLANYLPTLKASGIQELVYASPFCGYAQIAIAAAACQAQLKCRIFGVCDPQTSRPGNLNAHKNSLIAASFGASLSLCSSLHDAECAAADYARSHAFSHKLPLGLNCPEFKSHLREALAFEFEREPALRASKRVFLPIGSGTLVNVFRELLPASSHIVAVNVRVLDDNDPRVTQVSRLQNVTVTKAPETFEEPATFVPPIPSNASYDAKLWRFVCQIADNGDLWWNVAS